ncbi:hypothetical protein KKB10_04255 [Patescibacteria group bacterium]|nr:hypothetical protein [Patescibacteria group bacterium]MBU1074516.1 hypothetical protein [Patescibacteria group bacterium]MBU1951687.1 hypothetical protein [Patescibacteria group bacterium]MBU2229282.1 hypothetical protein [Patescibacteria group bacterium]
MGRFIFGIIGIIIGSLMVIKTEWFLRFFGKIEWAEQHLGLDGGTSLFYKLLGIAAIILSFMLMTGMLESIFEKVFSTGNI